MRVVVVSIGNELLFNDILDTNAVRVTRRLGEIEIPPIAKVTVGDDLVSIVAALRLALEQSDLVLAMGGLGVEENDFTRQAVAELTRRPLLADPPGALAGVILWGEAQSPAQAMLLEEPIGTLICLPGNPRELAYFLETKVLPYLQQRLDTDKSSGWLLLRTAGVMESTLQQQLADLNGRKKQRVTFASYAGQTDIRLWVEAESRQEVDVALDRLAEQVYERLGDHIYGREGDRLESVLLQQLADSHVKLAIAECYTGKSLAHSLGTWPGARAMVTILPAATQPDLAEKLDLPDLTAVGDLTRWCRLTAERLREETGADLGLVVYNNIAPGGVQLLVTLASNQGVSVMQRSFGGHPDNIGHWASTVGLVHVRRWLLAHAGTAA